MEIIGYILSLFIGICLGLIGSGGSILSIPILVYFFGLTPQNATPHSLFIVGITAAIACYKYYKAGLLKLKEAFIFAIPSVITLLFTRKYIIPAIPEKLAIGTIYTVETSSIIMASFSLLMIASAASMINKNIVPKAGKSNYITLLIASVCIGFITGFYGAGGGFLIIPALLFYGKMPLKYAISTSLLIITLNAFVGFVSDVVSDVYFDKILLVKISLIAIAGMFLGMRISHKIDGKKLKPIFGWAVFIMAVFILLKEIL